MHWSAAGVKVTDPAIDQLNEMEDRHRTMKTNPVTKSDEGWRSFREKTQGGKHKRPAVAFRNLRSSRYGRQQKGR